LELESRRRRAKLKSSKPFMKWACYGNKRGRGIERVLKGIEQRYSDILSLLCT